MCFSLYRFSPLPPSTDFTHLQSLSFTIVCKMALSIWIHAKYTHRTTLTCVRASGDEKNAYQSSSSVWRRWQSTKESTVKSTKSEWKWRRGCFVVKLNTSIRNIYFKLPHKHDSSVTPIFQFFYFSLVSAVCSLCQWLGEKYKGHFKQQHKVPKQKVTIKRVCNYVSV